MNNEVDKLAHIRREIDAIDEAIARLINQRGHWALQVAEIKQQDKEKPTYYRPEREAQILQRLVKRNTGPMTDRAITRIFQAILSASRALQQPLTVAVLGKDPLCQHAALDYFGAFIKTVSTSSISQLFQHVKTEQTHYGVVPIEHSRKGISNQTLDAFMQYPLQICGEIERRDVQQKTGTRFLIIGDHPTLPSGTDKTSLLISPPNQPGSLVKIFQPFACHHVNVTNIATRPSRQQLWNYVFFVDLEGHQQDEAVKNALAELSQQPLTYQLLGSYPRSML